MLTILLSVFTVSVSGSAKEPKTLPIPVGYRFAGLAGSELVYVKEDDSQIDLEFQAQEARYKARVDALSNELADARERFTAQSKAFATAESALESTSKRLDDEARSHNITRTALTGAERDAADLRAGRFTQPTRADGAGGFNAGLRDQPTRSDGTSEFNPDGSRRTDQPTRTDGTGGFNPDGTVR